MSTEPKLAGGILDPCDVAERFFAAIERGDLDAVKALYAPGAVIWHNHDRRETTVEANLQALEQLIELTRSRQYESRRLHAFDGGFAQQHVLAGARQSDGARVTIDACIVAEAGLAPFPRLLQTDARCRKKWRPSWRSARCGARAWR